MSGDWLKPELDACRRCGLWAEASQGVAGEGPLDASIALVGEQPGDVEDVAGRPFVGPAGRVLDEALAQAGLDRTRLYVTNAVKHFKWEPRGKRRLHKKPNAGEIEACRFWLGEEFTRISPRVRVALGATAAAALLERPGPVNAMRGRLLEGRFGATLVTVHPSYLLRLPDEALRAEESRRFVEDLALARALAES